MATLELGNCAAILPGHPFRSRLENEPEGQFVVVQPRDLGSDGRVDITGAVRLQRLTGALPMPLQDRDIVLQPRGTRLSAALFMSAGLATVAAAPLYIIRVDPRRALAEYVLASLLSPSVQAILRQAAVGTYVPQVSRQAIETLRIGLPDLPTQRQLADLAFLTRSERELMDRLRDARLRFFDLAVREAAAERGSRWADEDGVTAKASVPAARG